MEYLVTMTTHVPVGTSEEAIEDTLLARPPAHANLRHRDTCFACGVRRCSRASGARWAFSPPPTTTSSRTFSRPCRCGYGASDEVTPLSPHPTDPALVRR